VPGSAEWDCGGAYTGDVFGNVGLNIADEAAGWTAGQGGDCLGLVIDSWSVSSFVVSPGSFYPNVTATRSGDPYSLELQGHTFTGTIS